MGWGRKVTRLAQRAAFGTTVSTIEDAATGEVLRRFVLPRQPSGRPTTRQVRRFRENDYRVRWGSMADLPWAS